MAVIGSHRRSAFAIYDHVGNFHRLPDAQFHLQEVELHYTIGRHMRHPFLAHSFEVEDVVGIVRLDFAQHVKLYDGPAELSPGITCIRSAGIRRACSSCASTPAAAGSCWRPMSRILREHGDGPAFHRGVRIGDMLEACDTLRAHAPSPHHIVPGHDPLIGNTRRRGRNKAR